MYVGMGGGGVKGMGIFGGVGGGEIGGGSGRGFVEDFFFGDDVGCWEG